MFNLTTVMLFKPPWTPPEHVCLERKQEHIDCGAKLWAKNTLMQDGGGLFKL